MLDVIVRFYVEPGRVTFAQALRATVGKIKIYNASGELLAIEPRVAAATGGWSRRLNHGTLCIPWRGKIIFEDIRCCVGLSTSSGGRVCRGGLFTRSQLPDGARVAIDLKILEGMRRRSAERIKWLMCSFVGKNAIVTDVRVRVAAGDVEEAEVPSPLPPSVTVYF